jgi:hypothetical protein
LARRFEDICLASPHYVQRYGNELNLMVADPATGQAEAVSGASQPVDLKDSRQTIVGYYGQFGREELLANLPTEQASTVPTPAATPTPAAPSADDQDILNFIFKNHEPELGSLTEEFLKKVTAGQFSDFQRQEVDVNGDKQPEILISGQPETFYLFVTILKRNSNGQLSELFYTDNINGKYAGEVRVSLAGQRVVADFLTSTGGTGCVETTWEQRWIECREDSCQQVWSVPLLRADRNAQWTLSRTYAVADIAQPDDQTIRLTTRRFGLKELP